MDEVFPETLEEIGLSKNEASVYLALLKLQETQTGNLCNKANIASSHIYKILTNLLDKGLATYKIKNNVKIFMPGPPETLNDLLLNKQKQLEEQRKNIKETISKLKQIPQEDSRTNYKYFEGITSIKSMWNEINNSLDKKDIAKCYTCKLNSGRNFLGTYEEHHKIRSKKGVKAKLILPNKSKEIAMKREKQKAEIKFLDLNNDSEWGVIGDIIYLHYVTSKKPRGFLIQDEIFAKTFEQVFDKLWEQAKK
jgi:HTH-type transcriptional regulator, sugar sensing transcriptional regulator